MAKRIVAAVCALLWGIFGYIGFELVSRVAQRGVAGYPNAGQWALYVVFPAVMMLIGIGLVVFSRRAPTALYVGIVIVELAAVFPLLLVYGGGV